MEPTAATDRTFVIADIRGYTRFTRDHGDAAAAHLASVFADLAREAVEARGGEVLELRGDEALCVFEDSAQAVRAALEFQALCAEEYASDSDLPLNVGVGIDAGDAVPVQGGYRGAALNMAARLCSNAAAGQVLVSDAVAQRVATESDLSLADRGEATLKGFEGTVRLVEASDVDPPVPSPAAKERDAGPGLPLALDTTSALVGREHELHWLQGTWRQARRGRGRIVALAGPSQIGKTRLAAELAASVVRGGEQVRYAGLGGTAAAHAQTELSGVFDANAPVLLVLDDLDAMGPTTIEATHAMLPLLTRRPVLVVCTIGDDTASPSLDALRHDIDVRGDGERRLRPLDDNGVRGIVAQYVDLQRTEVPLESFVRSSGGSPGRVHEVVGSWTREEASRRLEAAAQWMAAGRSKRAADLEFANDVIGRGLHRLYADEPQLILDDGASPYLGLASFSDDDAGRFFGREALVGELAARTVQAGLLGVVGASGAGKSSVIAAGLIPSLRAGLLPGSERWHAVSMRPGEHPVSELAVVTGDTAAFDRAGERSILVVDQFEEVFTICADERERSAFIDAITELASHPDDSLVVVGLRGDHYGSCAPYPALAQLLAANNVLVGPMSRDELRRAIELPARRVGWRVEGPLVDALIGDTVDEPGALPLLSTALVELWQQSSDGWLRLDTYEQSGGVRGAVARLAERSYAELTPRQQDVARAVLLRLVAEDDDESLSRRRVPLAEFDADRDPMTASVLARLTSDRLLTRDEHTVEVAHEALLREWPRLRGWIADDVQGRRLRGHLTRSANQWAASDDTDAADDELYRGARLSAALDWSTDHGGELNDLERSFLQESRQSSEREASRQRRTNRRLRTALIGVAGFLVVALIAGAVAVRQRSTAQQQATSADAQRVGALAIVEKRPDLALLLAVEALRLDSAPETRGDLMQTLMKYPHMLGVAQPTGQRILRVAAPVNGRVFAVSDFDGGLVVYDGSTLTPLHPVIHLPFIDEMVFSTDGRTLFLAGWATANDQKDMSLRALDVATGKVRWKVPIPASERTSEENVGVPGTGLLALSPDGRSVTWQVPHLLHRYAVTTGHELSAPIPTLAGYQALLLPRHRILQLMQQHVRINDLTSGKTLHNWQLPIPDQTPTLSPDGRLLALSGWNGSADGVVATVDLRTGRVQNMYGQQHGWVPQMAFSPDGSQLATVNDGGEVTVWDPASGQKLTDFVGHTSLLRGVAFADAGRTLVTAGMDNNMITWDMSGSRGFLRTAPRPGPPCDTTCVFPHLDLTPDGTRIATFEAPVTGGSGIHFLDATTLAPVGRLPRSVTDCCEAAAFSPDGSQLATIDLANSTVILRDATTGEPIRQLFHTDAKSISKLGSPPLDTAAFAPDGSTVATNDNADVVIVDPSTGSTVTRLSTSDFVEWVSYSPDGTLLEAACDDGSVTVWDTSNWHQMWTRTIDDQVALGGQFSPDDLLLIAGSFSGRVHVINARTGEPTLPPLLAHAGLVGSLNFSPDGSEFATTGVDGLTYLWDSQTGRALGEPFNASGNAMNFFSKDGSTLYVSRFDTIFAFDVSVAAQTARACEIAGRTLTQAEWNRYLPDRPYQDPCSAPTT